MSILQPTDVTLKKHGLTPDEWRAMLDRQGGVCGACGTEPPSHRLNIDHEHVRGYWDMPAERKRKYHRGLVCYMCNKYRLARGATVDNLARASRYLANYAARKAEADA
jgi:hypothetical protein